MGGWIRMDRWIEGWMVGCTVGRCMVSGWTDEQMYGWMDRWMNEWTNGLIDG